MTAVLKTVPACDPLAEHVRAIIEMLGENVTREGLAGTPGRYADALRYLAGGYAGDVESVVGNGVFAAEGDGPVVMRDVAFHSLCASRCRSGSPRKSRRRSRRRSIRAASS
jgi:GTP cyclohydrolase I